MIKCRLMFSLLLVAICAHNAFGSCAKAPSIEEGAKGASLVFIGTVIQIVPGRIATADFPIDGNRYKWEL